MPEQLTQTQIKHLASLARLDLTKEELVVFGQQLTEVIAYNMDLLDQLDVAHTPPTAQTTGLVNVWREDEIEPSLTAQEALSQAPRQHSSQFEVPAVLDNE